MSRKRTLVTAGRMAARAALILLALFWLVFALLSGAGGGVAGVVANAPNAAPWLLLLLLVAVAFRWELFGGLTIVAAGVAFGFFFDAWETPVILYGVVLPLAALGGFLAACALLDPPRSR